MKYPTYMERQLMSDAELKKLDGQCKMVVVIRGNCVGKLSHPDMGEMYGYSDSGAELMMDTLYPSVKRLGAEYRITTKATPLSAFGTRGFLIGSDTALRKFMEMKL